MRLTRFEPGLIAIAPQTGGSCTLNRVATGGSMPEEFEGDLAGAVFWGADLSGARFRDVNLTDAKISHSWLVNVDIDALIDKVVINGVDVTAYVNERDPWYPLRAMLRPSDPEGMRFHPIGLPNSGSVDFPWPGLDYDLTPSVSEALAVRADRATRFRDYLATAAAADFTRPVDVLENGTNPVQECIHTVFEEEFWHNRYAQRDLAQLETAK